MTRTEIIHADTNMIISFRFIPSSSEIHRHLKRMQYAEALASNACTFWWILFHLPKSVGSACLGSLGCHRFLNAGFISAKLNRENSFLNVMMCIFRVTNSLNPPLSFSHGRRYGVMAIIFHCGRVRYAHTGIRGNGWRLWLRICKYGQIAYVHLHIAPWFRGQAAFEQRV